MKATVTPLKSDLKDEIAELQAEIDDLDGQIQNLEEERDDVQEELNKAEKLLSELSAPSACLRCGLTQELLKPSNQEEHLCCPQCGFCVLEQNGIRCDSLLPLEGVR